MRENREKSKRFLLLIVVGIIFFLIFPSCRTVEIEKPVYYPVKETENIVETFVDTVVVIRLVPEEKKNEVSPSDTSFLHNPYSFSWAFWDGWILHHYLGVNDTEIPVNVKWRDKLIIRNVPVPYRVDVPQPVNYLTWWQKIFIYIGMGSTVIILLVIVSIICFKVIKRATT